MRQSDVAHQRVAECRQREAALVPHRALLTGNPAAADPREFTGLFEACGDELSAELLDVVLSWKPTALSHWHEAFEPAWDLLFAYAVASPTSDDARQLLRDLSYSASTRSRSTATAERELEAEWRRRGVLAQAQTMSVGAPASDIERAAKTLQYEFIAGPDDIAIADAMARCTELLAPDSATRYLCAAVAGSYYRDLWKGGYCADCGETAYAYLRLAMDHQTPVDEPYRRFGTTWVDLLIELKRFDEAKRWIKRLLAEPQFRARHNRGRRMNAELRIAIPPSIDELYVLDSQADYVEALDFKERGQFSQCIDRLNKLTNDGPLRRVRPQLLMHLGDCCEAISNFEAADQAWFDALRYDEALKPEVEKRHRLRPDTGTAHVRHLPYDGQ